MLEFYNISRKKIKIWIVLEVIIMIVVIYSVYLTIKLQLALQLINIQSLPFNDNNNNLNYLNISDNYYMESGKAINIMQQLFYTGNWGIILPLDYPWKGIQEVMYYIIYLYSFLIIIILLFYK